MPHAALTCGPWPQHDVEGHDRPACGACGLWAALRSPMAAGTGLPDVWEVKRTGDGGLVQV